jgi:hypothetical protein
MADDEKILLVGNVEHVELRILSRMLSRQRNRSVLVLVDEARHLELQVPERLELRELTRELIDPCPVESTEYYRPPPKSGPEMDDRRRLENKKRWKKRK